MKKENPFKYLDIILIAKPDKDSTKMKIIMDTFMIIDVKMQYKILEK